MTTAEIDRFLGALAATKAGETSFYIYKNTNNKGQIGFVEKTFADGLMSPETYIGSASKSDGLAYLADKKGRLVVYVSDEGILLDHEYCEVDGIPDWNAGDIGQLKVAVYPQTKLAAVSRDDRRFLYFQSPSGDLHEMQYSDSSWQLPVVIAEAKPSTGAGLSAIAAPDGGRIFYHYHDDLSNPIHQVVFGGGSWKDYPVTNTSNALLNSRILAVGFNNDYVLYFQTSDNSFMSLRHLNNEHETLVKVGTMTSEGFKPDSTKQFGNVIFCPGSWPDFNVGSVSCVVM